MKVQLTDRFVANAKANEARQLDYFDAGTPGLSVRVSEAGWKAWCFVYTSPRNGKRARITLGTYPATTLADARTRAIEARGFLEEEPPRDPRDALSKTAGGAMTVADLIPPYLEKPNKRTGKPRRSTREIERRLKVNVVPFIGDVRLADLHRRDVNRIIAPVMKRGRPVEAARVFEDFRALVRWAVGQGYLDRNPMEGMESPAKAQTRDRVLSDDEIRTLWNGLPNSLVRSAACQRIIKLCLVTGQRVGEVAGMQSRELDLEASVWTIPGGRTKNGHSHSVPLSALALKLIKEASAAAGKGAQFIFPNPEGDASLPASAVARTITRAHEEDEERPDGRFGIAHWTAHDLRRTAVSKMAQLGVTPIVLGHIINHRSVTKAGVTLAVYSHYDYAKEKREALELWADYLRGLTTGGASVVAIKTA
jgi:integrase